MSALQPLSIPELLQYRNEFDSAFKVRSTTNDNISLTSTPDMVAKGKLFYQYHKFTIGRFVSSPNPKSGFLAIYCVCQTMYYIVQQQLNEMTTREYEERAQDKERLLATTASVPSAVLSTSSRRRRPAGGRWVASTTCKNIFHTAWDLWNHTEKCIKKHYK